MAAAGASYVPSSEAATVCALFPPNSPIMASARAIMSAASSAPMRSDATPPPAHLPSLPTGAPAVRGPITGAGSAIPPRAAEFVVKAPAPPAHST